MFSWFGFFEDSLVGLRNSLLFRFLIDKRLGSVVDCEYLDMLGLEENYFGLMFKVKRFNLVGFFRF